MKNIFEARRSISLLIVKVLLHKIDTPFEYADIVGFVHTLKKF